MDSTKQHSALSTVGLNLGYPSKKGEILLHSNVNLDFTTGSLTAIIGPNGVGKSTLIRTLTRAQDALAGNIFLDGVNANQISHSDWATKVSVVHTKAAISMNLTVFELVSLGRHPYTNWIGALKDRDHELIERAMLATEVTAFKDRKCHTLSDGQLQRVLIARAMAQDTPIIILDEPTTHLDLHHKSYVLSLLKELSKRGTTILFSTHDIDLVLDLCDQMVVLLPEEVHFDSPQKLIDQGVLSKLFGDKHIVFDTVNRRFTLNK